MYLLRTEYATKCISDIAQLFHKCKSLLHFLDFPWGSAGKESACNVRDLGLIPGLGRSPGEGKGYPLQYSGMENSMDCIVHGVTKSQTRLSDFHSLCNCNYCISSKINTKASMTTPHPFKALLTIMESNQAQTLCFCLLFYLTDIDDHCEIKACLHFSFIFCHTSISFTSSNQKRALIKAGLYRFSGEQKYIQKNNSPIVLI